MNPVQRPDSLEAAGYIGALRRHWLVVLGLTCLGLVAAFAYITVAPKSYTSTAVVYVTPTGADQSNQVANSRTGGGQVNLDTEAQVVVSTTVATRAAHMLHSPLTPWALSKEISVTVPPNSQVLSISCKAPSAKGAAACANAFAAAYLQNRSATAAATIAAQAKALTAKGSALQSQISALTTKISSLPTNSPTRLNDEAQVANDKSQLHSLTDQISVLAGLAAKSNGGSVITAASPPAKPSSPKKLLILPSGLIAGLLIGIVAAIVLDRRDKRIHDARDVEHLLDLPVLLDLPTIGRQVSIASPRSRLGQAFTELAHTVAAALGEGNHVLLVAGTTPGPGRSVIAANLAATLARIHSDVVLVCGDLNGTIAPVLLGIGGDGEGLAELVAGKATVRDVVRSPAALPGLWVITPGADPSLTLYNLQHDTARALISQLRRDARYVVIEALATGEGADTFAFGEFADAALLTIEVSRTLRPEAADGIRRLRQLRTPVLGAVVSPPVSGRVTVRPPRDTHQPRLGAGAAESGRDGVDARSASSAHSAMAAGMPETRNRPARSRDGHGDRDRVPGG